MNTVLLAMLVFVSLVLLLSASVMRVRRWLLPTRPVTLRLRDSAPIPARQGDTLLQALQGAGIQVPAACGGAGTCGQCRVVVLAGGGEALPSERARLDRLALRAGTRLACQLVLRNDLDLRVADSLLKAEQWTCTVVSNRPLTPLIRELVIQLPEGINFAFRPGSYVMLEAPAYQLAFGELEPAPEHREIWQRLQLDRLQASSVQPVRRAYSLANVPADGHDRVVLLVRLALPPPNRPGLPPGVVSSWLFARRPGDRLPVAGPFGEFAARESEREMIFIGGGVGMAPLRAMIADQLQRAGRSRQISYWYGARSRIELFYQDEFDALAAAHENFRWTLALSDPLPEDQWQGECGFIHEVLYQRYLASHPAPEDCEYYLCGPPLMIRAVLAMLDQLGVEPGQIFNDDFGSQ